MASENDKKTRWRYFIDKPFQIRFIARFSILIIIGLLLSIAVILISELDKYSSPLYFQARNINNPMTIYERVDSITKAIEAIEPSSAEDVVSTNGETVAQGEVKIKLTKPECDLAIKDIVSSISKLEVTTVRKEAGAQIGTLKSNVAKLEKKTDDKEAIANIKKALLEIRSTKEYISAAKFYMKYQSVMLKSGFEAANATAIDFSKNYNSSQLTMMPIILVSVLYLVLIVFFGLFISHKMAGPIFRIKKTLIEAVDGKHKLEDLKFRLRKNDELHDLVDALNAFLEKTAKK